MNGSTPPDVTSALHRHVPPPRTLITFGASASGGPYEVQFKVPIPDSRLRVKITLLYVRPAGSSAMDFTATLWLSERDLEDAGVAGSLIPTTDIEGTSASPTTIPANTGLAGYSREFVTAGDYIVGRLVASPGAIEDLGSWVLQTRYQPDAVRFTHAEWQAIKAQANPSITVGPLKILS